MTETTTTPDAPAPTPTVDKTGERIQEMFGQISPRYDFVNRVLSGRRDVAWRKATVKRVPPTNDSPILDCCTGTGDLALAYWKASRHLNSGQGVSVIGTDFTHEMLEIARQKQHAQSIAEAGDGSLSFLEADTMALPFSDDTFQIVSVAFGLRNVSDTRAGLAEMLRVCEPGGKVAVLEFAMPKNGLMRGAYKAYSKHVLPRIGQLLMRNKQAAYEYLPQSVQEFPRWEELLRMMEEVGMTNCFYKSLTFGVAALYVGEKPSAG